VYGFDASAVNHAVWIVGNSEAGKFGSSAPEIGDCSQVTSKIDIGQRQPDHFAYS